jgi:hypothetical protein
MFGGDGMCGIKVQVHEGTFNIMQLLNLLLQ